MTGLIVNGWAVTPEYASQLQTWHDGYRDQLDADEQPRAQRAVQYLRRRASRPRARGSVAELRAAIVSVISLLLLYIPAAAAGSAVRVGLNDMGPAATPLSSDFLWIYAPAPLILLATAVAASRLPAWLRVLAFIVGAFNVLEILIVFPILLGQLGQDALPAVLSTLAAGVVLIVALSIGGRR